MVEKRNLLTAVQGLLEKQEELVALCERQAGNAAFFSGVSAQARPGARAGLEAFLGRSQQHRLALNNLIDSIRADGRDVY